LGAHQQWDANPSGAALQSHLTPIATGGSDGSALVSSNGPGSQKRSSVPGDFLAEYDEDELTSVKKYSEISNYSVVASNIKALPFFKSNPKGCLLFCRSSHRISYQKPYLLFNVFRL